MLTFGWSWTRHWCYAEHGVGWGCERSFEVEHATDATLSMGWGGVGMLTFGWSWTRHWCYAEHGVGWGCERSFEVEHAIDATLSMGWGGDVNVRLKLNTPLMLRWAWGGVGMLTFGWSWTRHWCYAEHRVGWGGVGMLTFGWSWTRHWCYAEHGVVVSWPVEKNSTGLHAQWSLKLARQKKVRISCGRVAKRKKNDMFLKNMFTLRQLQNTERFVIFWQWWCAYTRDSAPGGMFILVGSVGR